MEKFRIVGGHKLNGSVNVCTSKNALLPILAGSILCDGIVTLTDVPDLSDISKCLDILRSLGVGVIRFGSTVQIDARQIDKSTVTYEAGKDIRASIIFVGALLSKFGKSKNSYPGGCNIGARPIDLHIDGLHALGVKTTEEHGYLICDGSQMRSATYQFSKQSVGATENLVLASVFLSGKTVLKNVAKEPEIADLANFLNKMGAKIYGAGTNQITIYGVKKLHGTTYRAIPDRIVAGTYLVATAVCGGSVEICQIFPKHIESTIKKLARCGCNLTIKNDKIYMSAPERCVAPHSITTGVYPKFPTDMQSIFLPLLAVSKGTCEVREKIFENRFRLVPELVKMGAKIDLVCGKAVVRGVPKLSGANVVATDLRAGAGLVLGGLCASGYTTVEDIHYIDRGYPKIENDLKMLGADIERIG